MAETAGRVCGLPFSSFDSTSLTAEGFVGLSIDDAVKQLIVASRNDLEKARYSILLLDEWDKRRVSGWETGGRDIAGASVQQEVLRLIEGHEFIIGGRRGNWDWSPVPFQSRGVFVFAGAFCGLDEILDKQGAHGIGFGSPHEGSKGQRYLLDALQEFGLIPEFVNRLTGVLMIPAPTIEQLMSIATRNVIPVFNNVLASCKAQIQVDENAIRLMAESALESRTFARGIKSIISRLVEDLVFEEVQGVVHLGVAEVRQAIEAAGLGAVTG